MEAFNSCRGGKISVTSRTVCSTYWALGQWTEEEGKRSREEERRERGGGGRRAGTGNGGNVERADHSGPLSSLNIS